MPNLTRKQLAIQGLGRLIAPIEELKQIEGFDDSRFSLPFLRWQRQGEVALGHIFGDQSPQIMDFIGISYYNNRSELSAQEDYVKGLDYAKMYLESLVDEAEVYLDDNLQSVMAYTPTTSSNGPATPTTRKVFVVHGHDHGFKDAVARVLSKLELEPIILHEQPDQGRTIIEKFSDYADVSFAVALFTPDDLGEAKTKIKTREDLVPRARQNVIFEFGYFIGKLGRSNACGLTKGKIDVPSDYSGVLYIPFDDAGHWKYRLAGELRAAKFDIDANKLL